MVLQKRDIEEVGEAVEALGIMLEKELGGIKQDLAELYRFVAQMKKEGEKFSGEVQKLKEEMTRTQKLLQGFETLISRTESKLIDLQKVFSDEEDYTGEIKSDLLIIKRDLQFARSDLKELLKRSAGSIGQEYLEKKLDLEERKEGLEE